MLFTPKSEQQIIEENLLPAGDYGFEVFEAEEKVSQSGSPMLVLKLKLFDLTTLKPCGFVMDYLLEKLALKLRHAAYACSLGDAYEQGCLVARSFVRKTGTVKIGIQKSKDPAYADKNSVFDYVVSTDVQSQSVYAGQSSPTDRFSDDINL